jgi:hypothetical protein
MDRVRVRAARRRRLGRLLPIETAVVDGYLLLTIEQSSAGAPPDSVELAEQRAENVRDYLTVRQRVVARRQALELSIRCQTAREKLVESIGGNIGGRMQVSSTSLEDQKD